MAYTDNSGGYESMVWVNDRHGREFACYINDVRNFQHLEELPEQLRELLILGSEKFHII
jgi:hypothetical protein